MKILDDIKTVSGVHKESDVFDDELILYAYSVLFVLTDIGGKLNEGYVLTKDSAWDEIIDTTIPEFNPIRTYVGLKVRLKFDRPASQHVADALERDVKELEWRLHINLDVDKEEEE